MKDGMKNGYSKIHVRCKHLSSMIMGDVESDEHLRIFKCLIDTGSHVLRNAIGIKVLNNNSISFIQYLENNKHQFYHQFEKKIWRKCCLGSPHGCVFPGTMDKKIFNKMYNKTAEHNTQDCLDRFKTNAGISLDGLDLSDLNFFLWNSSSLSAQEEHSLKKIMSIRSAICHPSSSHSYSIDELETYWSDLKSAVLLFAEPKFYKDIVEMQVETLQNCKLNVIESAKVIEKMKIESNKILHAIKQATPLKIVDIKKLIKDGTCGLENCVKSENNKTKSYINDTFQTFKENFEKNHEALSKRCREEIQTTVTQESSKIRLHSEDQNREIDTKLTESEQRVCQTVIQSQGRLENKLIEEQNKTMNHTVELKADLIEENRILKDEVMDVKTELKELKTILIGYIGKQKVDLVINTDQIEKSTESPENRKVDFTARVNQTQVTADKEIPPEVEIQTNNDSSPEPAVTETIEITGKKVNSIILELKATPGILHSVDSFKAAILRLVQVMQTAGGIDVDIEDTVTVNLKFESPLTEDQFAVVKCLFAKEWNSDNDTTPLLDECSSISDEYSSTADVDEIKSLPELDIYSQKDTSEFVLPESTEYFTKPSCKYCDDKDKIIRTIEQEKYNSFEWYIESLSAEISKVKGLELENSRLKQFVEDEVMDVKTELKELKTILIGYIDKQKVDLVMNTGQIEKSIESPDNIKVDFTATVNQTHVTADKENEIIENLPPEIKIQTYNDSLSDAAVTETIEITGKKVNSIILELKATPGILHSVDTFKAAILTLVQVMQKAGGIDVDIEDTVTVNLKFESPLTEDQFAVVKCLFAKEWNSDNDTTHLLDECSSISDEYLSTGDVEEIEFQPEQDIYSLKETSESVQPESTEAFTKPSCKYCDDKDKIIRTLEDQNDKSEMFKSQDKLLISEIKRFQKENHYLMSRMKDDIGMISKTGKLGMTQTVSTSDDFSGLVSKHTYGLHNEDSKLRDLLRQTHIDDTGMHNVTEKIQKDLKSSDKISLKPQQTHYLSSKTIVDECRNCFEKDEIIIQLDRRLCEIRRRVTEAKKQTVSGNIFFEDLLQFIHHTTNMTSVEEKERMKYKELKSVMSSQKSELISDVDVRDPEKKANKELMESQASKGRRPELDQTEEKSELSLRISEIRREYASSLYTKTDKQKGLGIIVQAERSGIVSRYIDPDTTHLQEFFDEIGFIVECTGESDHQQLLNYMTDGQFYCVVIVFLVYPGYQGYNGSLIRHLLSQRVTGKPVIIMTDFTFPTYYMEEINEDNEILTVMPRRQGGRGPYGSYGDSYIFEDFVKATRRNRFADIMDILTRMNALYEYPIITFQSSLRKKFCFL